MFKFKIEKELYCIAEGSGKFYAKKGAMVAYKGDFKFEKSLFGPNDRKGIAGVMASYIGRAITGENIPLMEVTGNGSLHLAQNAYHVEIFELDPHSEVSVESESILAFPSEVDYSVRMYGKGLLSEGGLFVTTLKNNTNEIQSVVLITNGNPLLLETPCTVDPNALIAFTGADPNIKTDVSWKTFVGQTSGESYQLVFNTRGEFVLIQPAERIPQYKISID